MKGKWRLENVGGQPCHIYDPVDPNPHGYVVLYLHGVHLNRLADQPAFMAELDRHGLPAVCPVAGRCWWVDRRCPDFPAPRTPYEHIMQQVVPWIGEHLRATTPQIGLIGTSMGGQGVLQLAYRHPDRFPVVVAISPAIDFHRRIEEGDEILLEMYEDPEIARQDTVILQIHPLNWPRHQYFCCDPTDDRWYDGADRLRMKLNSLGIPFEYDLETIGGGHGFEYYSVMAPRAFQFLMERLDRERLRLPIG